MIQDESIKLIRITGHSITTLGKTYLSIQLPNRILKHPVYVIKDDAPLEYDGIIGADFIRKNNVTCNYGLKATIKNTSFKLYPYRRMTLKARSKTIVQVTADRNTIGVTQSEETTPGIFIGSCLVQPKNFECPISILNIIRPKARSISKCLT